MSVLHQSISIFQSSRLASQVHMMAVQDVKEKCLICQVPIKMLKQHATPNSRLHNLKIYSSKGCRKTSQKWIVLCTYLASTAIQVFSRTYQIMGFCFDWWILLLLTDQYHPVCYKVNDAKTFKNLVYYFVLAYRHVYCRLARLIGSFKIILI